MLELMTLAQAGEAVDPAKLEPVKTLSRHRKVVT